MASRFAPPMKIMPTSRSVWPRIFYATRHQTEENTRHIGTESGEHIRLLLLIGKGRIQLSRIANPIFRFVVSTRIAELPIHSLGPS